MSEHKDMTISEIDGIVEEYTKEFVEGEENWYVYLASEDYYTRFRTSLDSTKIVYFESEEKIEDLRDFLGKDNFLYYFRHIYKDFDLDYTLLPTDKKTNNIRPICEKLDMFNMRYYIYKNMTDDSSFWYIVPEKVNGYYRITYKESNLRIKLGNIDLYFVFESIEEAKEAVEEAGEYNILHYFYLIKESLIQKDLKNESDTTQKDMVKNPSHYQGKHGLEVYDVLENFLEDVESYYVGNIIKYILRYRNKNGLEDIKKAREYADKLIELWEK